jgi:hypothetical protein
MLAVVRALKANERAQALVPATLLHYLTDPILPSGWYPERDYDVLIDALARSVDPAAVGGNAWLAFGRIGAQRDIAGMQEKVPPESRTEIAGVYRKLGDGVPGDIVGMFARLTKLWSMYHDSGTISVGRHASDEAVVVSRLTDFRFPSRGPAELQTGYSVEFARLLGIKLEGKLSRLKTDGEPHCEWHYRVQATPENLAMVASLELLPER